MHRIRDLELNVGSRSYLPVASGAPQLRNLTLRLAEGLQYDMRELFGKIGAPNLEVLMVSHCTGVSLDVVSFPRTLRAIILPSFSPGPIPPMAELLQIFEQLREFVLRFASSALTDTQLSHPVSLEPNAHRDNPLYRLVPVSCGT